MKPRFRSNFSATTLQLCINQLFSVLVFYLLSDHLSKPAFGELNWTLALFIPVFSVASFGLDQLVVKKIAEGEHQKSLLSLHLFHVLASGLLFYGLLFLLSQLFGNFFFHHQLILFLGLGKLLLFFSTPFKAIAAGGERFRVVLWMSVSSAILKGSLLLFAGLSGKLTLSTVIPFFIVADGSELLLGLFLTRKFLRLPLAFTIRLGDYARFLKEALPQIGVVVFASALARIDWILIGLFLSAAKLAEYSFAYKAFELSSLPLLAIAPLLVPAFTRMVHSAFPHLYQDRIRLLLRVEMMIACFISLCLNILWNPCVDLLTGGKYGAVNTKTILILSMTLPVLYLNNYLWSLHFAYGNMRLILYSFILCFTLNVTANLLLLPLFGNEGAAAAYFISILAQTFFYASHLKEDFSTGLLSLAACTFCAFTSGYLSPFFTTNTPLLLLTGSVLYVVFLRFTIPLRRKDWALLRQTIVR